MKNVKVLSLMAGCFLAACPVTAGAQHVSPEPPIMGWSSWNTYRVNINEVLIRTQADAMVRQGLQEAGYRFVNIDDGFFGWRDKEGVLHTHPERFPDGMKGIADYIHSLGLKAGIYSEAGSNTCGSIWDADRNGIGVGMYGFERQDADLFFNKWGFDFVKIDYCGAGQQLDLDEEERYTAIVEAIREVSPKNISLNVCRWAYPGTWVKGLATSWRISGDITPSWTSVRDIIARNRYLSAFAGDGHYNDMDMLEIGRGLSQTEEETHFGMWCMLSSPLLIGCDLTRIPEKSLELLKNCELIALNQDPLGLQAYVVQHEGEGYVFVKDILQPRGRVRAVALYNPSDSPCAFSVPLSCLELEGKTRLRDLVRGKDERPVSDCIRFEVPAHGVKILRAEAERRLEPQLYEAEHAYLNEFDDLAKRPRGIAYMPFEGASGGMTICNVGGHASNYAEWKEVFSEKGGAYRMTIHYVPAERREREICDRRLTVSVNGNQVELDGLETDRSKGVATVALTVTLRPGYNVVRMGSRLTWTPDLDCFTLVPLSE